MDLIKTTPADRETETPQPPPSNKTNKLCFANGTLKRHHHTSPPQAMVVSHRECLKNHAASIGGHALDGCGEFMPSPAATAADPTSLKCAACGCHRNFHRRESDDEPITHFHHLHLHHHPPPPPPFSNSPSPSPPPQPQPSSYYSSAPHMLLALRTGASPPFDDHHHHHAGNPTAALMKIENNTTISSGKKRFRTKFSPEQKDKMYKFSEKLGWKMQKSDENLVEEFCNEIGVGKGVLKVWMHNNKHTLGKREIIISPNNNHSNNNEGDHNPENDNRIISFDTTTINGQNNSINGSNNNNNDLHVSTNGSSSSS